MKLTFFLLGSNTAREEIIGAPCCDLLVCGRKTEAPVVLVLLQHDMVGRVMSPLVEQNLLLKYKNLLFSLVLHNHKQNITCFLLPNKTQLQTC